MCHLMSHGCRQIHSRSARCCPARLPSMCQRATTLRPTLKAGPQAGIWAEVAALFHWPIYWLRSVSSDLSGYNALSGYSPDTSQQHTRRLSAHRPPVILDGSAGLTGLTAPYHLLLHVIDLGRQEKKLKVFALTTLFFMIILKSKCCLRRILLCTAW